MCLTCHQNLRNMEPQKKLSVAETIALLVASGAKLVQKSGAFMMPVRRGYREAVERNRLQKAYLKQQKNGSIINISTFAIFEPNAHFPTSGVFRSGLAAFTKIYSDKYAIDNIRMNNILPGFIDSLPEKNEFLKRIPLGRYGKVSEISAVVEMLASDGGAYITGQNIRVDGGITRSV